MAKLWCLLARKNYMFRPIAAIFLANKHHHLAIIYSCVFDEIHLTM